MRDIHEQLNEAVRRRTEGSSTTLGVSLPYASREAAGRSLANALAEYAGSQGVLVLAIPLGGVPVAREVAGALRAPLDILVVKKLTHPERPEVAAGAIAAGGVRVENRDVLESIGIRDEELENIVTRGLEDLQTSERELRGQRVPIPLDGRIVILVDDGLVTGATMRAAIASARVRGAARVVVAAPIAVARVVEGLGRDADQVVCPTVTEPFFTISQFYEDFTRVDVAEARRALEPGGMEASAAAEALGQPMR